MAGIFERLRNKFNDFVSAPGARDEYDDDYDQEYGDEFDEYDGYEHNDSRDDSSSRQRRHYEESRDSSFRRNDHREERDYSRDNRTRHGDASSFSGRAGSTYSRPGGPDILHFDGNQNKQHTRPNAETVIVRPKVVQDAIEICDHMRAGRMSIINLTGLDTSNAQRIADYLGGVCHALDGVITRVDEGVFTVAPQSHRVMNDYRDATSPDSGFFSKAANDR